MASNNIFYLVKGTAVKCENQPNVAPTALKLCRPLQLKAVAPKDPGLKSPTTTKKPVLIKIKKSSIIPNNTIINGAKGQNVSNLTVTAGQSPLLQNVPNNNVKQIILQQDGKRGKLFKYFLPVSKHKLLEIYPQVNNIVQPTKTIIIQKTKDEPQIKQIKSNQITIKKSQKKIANVYKAVPLNVSTTESAVKTEFIAHSEFDIESDMKQELMTGDIEHNDTQQEIITGDLEHTDTGTVDNHFVSVISKTEPDLAADESQDMIDSDYENEEIIEEENIDYEVQTEEEVIEIYCEICGNIFQDDRKVAEHVIRMHARTSEEINSEYVKRAIELIESLKSSGGAGGRKKKWNKPKVPDTRKRTIPCSDCNKKFKSEHGLTIHVRKQHTEKSDHPPQLECDYCGKEYRNTTLLIVHKRNHTGERPFQCEYCERQFTSKSYLKMHQTIHTGERPFVCKLCGMTFRTPSNYKRHLLTHTGEKPYACPHCPSAFSQPNSLKEHVKYVHLAHTRPKRVRHK